MLRKMTLLCVLSACEGGTWEKYKPTTTADVVVGKSSETARAEQAVVVLDAVPLTTTFQRFFGVTEEIFTEQQRKYLGTISYLGATPILLNGRTKRQLDQAYLRTLRVVLLTQCQQLASKEVQALTDATAEDKFSQHVLIKRYGAPQAEEVSAIMTSMFGYQNSAGLHRGAHEYASLMATNLTAFASNNSDTVAWQDEVRKQYVLLCMAIGQDARVYLR